MKIHEYQAKAILAKYNVPVPRGEVAYTVAEALYQAKAILAKYNVPVPRGEVAFSVAEAEAAAKKIGGSVVIKAQIHAGGRGKGGGVKIAKSFDDVAAIAEQSLGMTLITHQTGPEGRLVQR